MICEEGNELTGVHYYYVWDGSRYKFKDDLTERDWTDYQFDGYICPECGEILPKEDVEKLII